MIKPTIKQKLAFEDIKRQVANKESVSMAKALKAANYAPSVCNNPILVTERVGWKQLMASIDDNEIVENVRQIALDKDKRAALAAADMIFKLKDRYPQKDSKMVGLFKEV